MHCGLLHDSLRYLLMDLKVVVGINYMLSVKNSVERRGTPADQHFKSLRLLKRIRARPS